MADLFIGLMSGTSMDGIDAALVDFSTDTPNILATHSHPYPVVLHRQLQAALDLKDPLTADLTAIDDAVGEVFAAAANELLAHANHIPDSIAAIGSHGQTIRHEPDIATPYSLQIGNPELIASLTNIDVVADFRRADIEAGGQGAPLVPAFHRARFSSAAENRVILNIGGIANITTLPADASKTAAGFDTGPGNTLMDLWANRHLNTAMDTDGQWAAAGEVDYSLLASMIDDEYLLSAPPKSTGREYFNADWLSHYIARQDIPAQTIQATLCELTAQSIATAIRIHAADTRRLIVCGGGVHNSHLMTRLQANLPGMAIDTTAAHGLDPDWVEAAAFAWLAQQRLADKPGNIPEVTGANHPALLGNLFRH
jgi:anhydro-N-acetylmuramic acid kinase